MSKYMLRAGLSALAFCFVLPIALPAQAGVSEDFADCDGLKKPKRSNDGMRGEASTSGYSFVGAGRSTPERVVLACDAALDSGKIRPNQTLRLAHVLRARAAAKLQLGDVAEAIEDLDAAETAASSYVGDFFYDRSMGASLKLLRAIALNESDRREEALALAQEAASTRPYALQIQRAAAALQTSEPESPHGEETTQHLLRIDPEVREATGGLGFRPPTIAFYAENAGEPELVLPNPRNLTLQYLVRETGGSTLQSSRGTSWNKPVSDAMTTAYALTAIGDHEAANAWMNVVSETLDEAMAEQEPEPEMAFSEDTAANAEPKSEKELREERLAQANRELDARLSRELGEAAKANVYEPMALLIGARRAIDEGNLQDAAAIGQIMGLRSTLVTREFHSAYVAARAASGDETLPLLPELKESQRQNPSRLTRFAEDLLIKPEAERALIDYKKSRPKIFEALFGAALTLGTSLIGGVERSMGFSSMLNPDGSIKVEYTGDKTSGPIVQEMTLLRAAELAKEAGAARFEIVERKDFQRFMTTYVNNFPQSRRPAGYKTELTIRLVGEGDTGSEGLDAVAVIDELGPIYYDADA
jgi:hypothetical protein